MTPGSLDQGRMGWDKQEVKRFGHWNSNCLLWTKCFTLFTSIWQVLLLFCKTWWGRFQASTNEHIVISNPIILICVDIQKWKPQTSWHTSCHLKESSSLSTDRQLISSSLPHSQREVGSVWKCLCFTGSRGVSSWCGTDMWMSGNSVRPRDP